MTAPSTRVTSLLTQFGLTTAAEELVPRLTQAGHPGGRGPSSGTTRCRRSWRCRTSTGSGGTRCRNPSPGPRPRSCSSRSANWTCRNWRLSSCPGASGVTARDHRRQLPVGGQEAEPGAGIREAVATCGGRAPRFGPPRNARQQSGGRVGDCSPRACSRLPGTTAGGPRERSGPSGTEQPVDRASGMENAHEHCGNVSPSSQRVFHPALDGASAAHTAHRHHCC